MNILVIAPHPDDEVLGMGGTIKKLSKVLKHDKIWNADKCLRYGLVNKIV